MNQNLMSQPSLFYFELVRLCYESRVKYRTSKS